MVLFNMENEDLFIRSIQSYNIFADDPATQESRASTAMILTQLLQIIPVSTSKDLILKKKMRYLFHLCCILYTCWNHIDKKNTKKLSTFSWNNISCGQAILQHAYAKLPGRDSGHLITNIGACRERHMKMTNLVAMETICNIAPSVNIAEIPCASPTLWR